MGEQQSKTRSMCAGCGERDGAHTDNCTDLVAVKERLEREVKKWKGHCVRLKKALLDCAPELPSPLKRAVDALDRDLTDEDLR